MHQPYTSSYRVNQGDLLYSPVLYQVHFVNRMFRDNFWPLILLRNLKNCGLYSPKRRNNSAQPQTFVSTRNGFAQNHLKKRCQWFQISRYSLTTISVFGEPRKIVEKTILSLFTYSACNEEIKNGQNGGQMKKKDVNRDSHIASSPISQSSFFKGVHCLILASSQRKLREYVAFL